MHFNITISAEVLLNETQYAAQLDLKIGNVVIIWLHLQYYFVAGPYLFYYYSDLIQPTNHMVWKTSFQSSLFQPPLCYRQLGNTWLPLTTYATFAQVAQEQHVAQVYRGTHWKSV